MKVQFYRYDKSTEAQELMEAHFTKNEVDITSTPESLSFMSAVDGDVTIPYAVTNEPLVVDGHEFELLRRFQVTFNVDGSEYRTKELLQPLSTKEIAEKGLTAWANAKLGRKQRESVGVNQTKLKEEKELLRSLLNKSKLKVKAK